MATQTQRDRQKQYKKGIDADESRRRREDTTIQIRKTKKEERLNQRRRMAPVSDAMAGNSLATPGMDSTGPGTVTDANLAQKVCFDYCYNYVLHILARAIASNGIGCPVNGWRCTIGIRDEVSKVIIYR